MKGAAIAVCLAGIGQASVELDPCDALCKFDSFCVGKSYCKSNSQVCANYHVTDRYAFIFAPTPQLGRPLRCSEATDLNNGLARKRRWRTGNNGAIEKWIKFVDEHFNRMLSDYPADGDFERSLYTHMQSAVSEWQQNRASVSVLELQLHPILFKILDLKSVGTGQGWLLARTVLTAAVKTKTEQLSVWRFCAQNAAFLQSQYTGERILLADYESNPIRGWRETPYMTSSLDLPSVCPNLAEVQGQAVKNWRRFVQSHLNMFLGFDSISLTIENEMFSTLQLAVEEWRIESDRRFLTELRVGMILWRLLYDIPPRLPKHHWALAKAVVGAAAATNSESSLLNDFCDRYGTQIVVNYYSDQESDQQSEAGAVDWWAVCPNLHTPKQGKAIWEWNVYLESRMIGLPPGRYDGKPIDQNELFSTLNSAVFELKKQEKEDPTLLEHLRIKRILRSLVNSSKVRDETSLVAQAAISAAVATKSEASLVDEFCKKHTSFVEFTFKAQKLRAEAYYVSPPRGTRWDALSVPIDWAFVCPSVSLP